jgi:hypothetical protein
MADILLICLREEDKDDFVVELIKGLMSRGLTVSYAGAYYNERKDRYVYDDVTSLLFFSSTYFRGAKMKSKEFRTWKGFLDNIDFEQADARLVIYANICRRKIEFGTLRTDFGVFLETNWASLAFELIKNSFNMKFPIFVSHYPDLVEILGLNEKLLQESKERAKEWEIEVSMEWYSEAFYEFIKSCKKLESEQDQVHRKEILQEIEKWQKKVEKEFSRTPLRNQELITAFISSETIDEAAENPERLMFFDISRRIPKKRILCLYYEEERNGEAINLYFYPKYGGEAISSYFHLQDSNDEVAGESTERILRFSPEKLEKARDLYEQKNIEDIIDKRVMLALHPSLIDIHFPINDFMLEVDPEEPEIGFLSSEISLENCQDLEEILKVNAKLRKKVLFYKYREKKEEEGGKFLKLKIDREKEENREKLIVLGRIENLHRILIADKWYGRIYQLIPAVSKPLALFLAIYLALSTLQAYSEAPRIPALTLISMFILPVVVLSGTIFIFWGMEMFALNYLLDPMYRILKWSTYVTLLFTLSLGTRYVWLLLAFSCGLLLFHNYIRSAIFFDLSNSFDIVDQGNSLCTEGLDVQFDNGHVEVLRCGRFKTTVKKENSEKVYLNSSLFHRIKWVSKKFRTIPRKMAYSSGIFLSPKNKEVLAQDIEEDLFEELIYRKPKKWGFWGILINLLLGKGEIESNIGLDSKPSANDRFIYFGQWEYVMRHIRSAIPIFPQSALLRNMIVLIVLSGFIFNILGTHEISFEYLIEWIREISLSNIAVYSIALILSIIAVKRFRFRFWKIMLVALFLYLLWMQPDYVRGLVLFSSISILALTLFPIEQACYCLLIWIDEKTRGNIVSVTNKESNYRGTRIQKNILVTRLVMNDLYHVKDKRIYFNKRFYYDIVKSDDWKKLRENPRNWKKGKVEVS